MSGIRTIEFGPDDAANARALRDAFGCFTTGVTVVTTRAADGRPVGFTANSFASVSLDPPLVLMCVDLKSQSLPALEAAGIFAVNVLHVDQQATAQQFTRKDMDRFSGLETEVWGTGAPILAGCMANFECRTESSFEAGDHRVFIGRALQVRFDPQHEPLVYLQGRYRQVHVDP